MHVRQRELAERLSGDLSLETVLAATASILTPPTLPLYAEDMQLMTSRMMGGESWFPVDKQTLTEAEYFLHWAEVAYGMDTSAEYEALTQHLAADEAESASLGHQKKALVETVARADRQLSRRMSRLRKFALSPMDEPMDLLYGKEQAKEGKWRRMSGRSGGGVERTAQKWRENIRKRLHTNDDDILDLQLENRAVGNVPYFIALDYRKQCIIVSIRGSSTIQDAFTDMITTAAPLATLLAVGGLFGTPIKPTCTSQRAGAPTKCETSKAHTDSVAKPEAGAAAATTVNVSPPSEAVPQAAPESATAPNSRESRSPGWQQALAMSSTANKTGAREFDDLTYPGGYAHRGVLLSAVRLLECIRDKGVLAEAVKRRPNWDIVITGHSLGAGLAALLAMALRPELGDRISCWAYCPPGGLVSVEQAINMSGYVTSVLHGKDPVSRMTWRYRAAAG